MGDAIVSAPEWQKGPELLSFAGIPPAYVAMLPKDQHFAEKAHAYTYPRKERMNSRTRDLVDLILLIEQGLPDKEALRKAVQATFNRRRSHKIPALLEAPPELWRETYQELAADCGVTKKTMDDAFKLLQVFWTDLKF